MSVLVHPSSPDVLDRLREPELIERAKCEPAAFAELYRRHRLDVYGFAFARLRNRDDAEDLTSEVFVRALAAIGRYQDRGIPFRSWLFQIGFNAIMDQHRRRRPVEDIDQHPELAAEGSLEDLVARREQLRRVALAARRLPARQAAVLVLRFGHDLKVAEIGARLGGSEGAAKLLLHRALARVRATLRERAGALELAS